jgi:SAM-dependent methyltransferase
VAPEVAVAHDPAVRALQAHPMVASARRVAGAERVIEVVPRTEVATEVAGWRYLFEDMYDDAAPDPGPAADASLVGWVDSFTGAPLPAAQMSEWVAASVSRIRHLRPRRLLEIGAGTGLIMRELLADGDLRDYIATDFAESSVRILRSMADEMAGGLAGATRVSTVTAAADEVLAKVDGSVDTAVLNSVVQYFPSARYLESVIGDVLEVVEPGGHVFLGDLRDATVLGEFYRQRHHRRGHPREFAPEHDERRDFELSLVPEYIRSLAARFPAVTAAEVAPRRGRHANEMALFRFDAVLHVGCPPPQPFPAALRTGTVSPAELSRYLMTAGRGGAGVLWQGIGNARVIAAADAVDPEAIWALDGVAGCRVRAGFHPGGGGDRLEVWGSPGGGPDEHFALSWPHAAGPAACAQPPLPPGAGWALRDALADGLPSCDEDTRITLACAHTSETERAS